MDKWKEWNGIGGEFVTNTDGKGAITGCAWAIRIRPTPCYVRRRHQNFAVVDPASLQATWCHPQDRHRPPRILYEAGRAIGMAN